MAKQINYSHESLLEVKFAKNVKGYDALEVDKTLDEIISDYMFYEQYYQETRGYIEKIEREIKKLKDRNNEMEIEVAGYRNKFGLVANDPEANSNNINYLTRIRKLENELYKKGVDPTKIK